jgi:hypothetical protein
MSTYNYENKILSITFSEIGQNSILGGFMKAYIEKYYKICFSINKFFEENKKITLEIKYWCCDNFNSEKNKDIIKCIQDDIKYLERYRIDITIVCKCTDQNNEYCNIPPSIV